MPPMSSMTLPMSGTNRAMPSVAAIQVTVSATRLRHSWASDAATALHFGAAHRSFTTDLGERIGGLMAARGAAPAGGTPSLSPLPSPAQQHHNGVNGDNGDAKEQAGNDDKRVISWVGHQDIGRHSLAEGQVAIEPC